MGDRRAGRHGFSRLCTTTPLCALSLPSYCNLCPASSTMPQSGSRPPPLNLLVLAPLSDSDKARIEKAFDKVHYGKLEISTPTQGPPAPVDPEVLSSVTCVFGWMLPGNVSTTSDIPQLRWQMTPSAGTDKLIKTPYYLDLVKQGNPDGRVQLTTNSGVHCYVIPSYVLAMVVNLFTRAKEHFETQILRQKWERPEGFYVRELVGSTFGILGYGRLGREVARLAKAYGCNVIAATSDGSGKPDPEGALLCPGIGDPEASIPSKFYSTRDESSLHAFLGQTDVLVICLPATRGTYKMINSKTLGALKKDAVVVNIGRGEVVDTDALIVSPHVAGVTARYIERSVDMLLVNAERLRKGEELLNAVDLSKGY